MSKFRDFLGTRGFLPVLGLRHVVENLDDYLDEREDRKWAPFRPAAVREHYERLISATNHQLIQDREVLKERLREVERQSAFLSASLTQENQKAREFSKQYVETAQTLARFRGEWVPPCYSDPSTGYWKLGFDHRPGGLTYVGEEEMDHRIRSAREMEREIIRSMAPRAMVEGDLYPCPAAIYHWHVNNYPLTAVQALFRAGEL